MLDARGRLYFAATDTDKSRLSSTGVESAWLLDQLEQCRARRQVLILDCCFSGSFAHTNGDPEVDLERRLVGAGRGRAVLTASRAGEYSYEGIPLPGAPGGSVFTAALVDGLHSGDADRDGDGLITVEDAYDYAANQVTARGGAQSPQRWLYGSSARAGKNHQSQATPDFQYRANRYRFQLGRRLVGQRRRRRDSAIVGSDQRYASRSTLHRPYRPSAGGGVQPGRTSAGQRRRRSHGRLRIASVRNALDRGR